MSIRMPWLVALALAMLSVDACTAARPSPAGERSDDARPAPGTAAVHHGQLAAGVAMSPTVADTSLHPSGKRVVETLCVACHSLAPPKTAPPLGMVAMHYRRRSANELEAIERMVEWVRAPDAARSLMPPMVLREFGLMPPQPLPDSLLRAAAAYVMSLQHAMPMHGSMRPRR